MTSSTTVATANVLETLTSTEATAALDGVLAARPDLVGLQEWYPSRARLLLPSGSLGTVPDLGVRVPGSRLRGTSAGAAYRWNAPLVGGCVLGARADRYELISCRPWLLSLPGLADRRARGVSLEPGRVATVALYRDLHLARTVCLVGYHLVSGVQAGGRYRDDRPLLVARHQREGGRLRTLVDRMLREGLIVHAVGDSNLDGFTLPGLTSAWTGHPPQPGQPAGTLGRRRVDDVLGPGPASSVQLLESASDHRALVVRRED